MRDSSVDSRANGGNVTDDDSRTMYGDGSDKFNAKIIGYTKDGDVIIRISPELTQDLAASSINKLARVKSGVRFDDELSKPTTPAAIATPRLSIDKETEVEEIKRATPTTAAPPLQHRRHEMTRHHSSSTSITFKGKEKQPSIQERRERREREREQRDQDETDE